MIIDSHGHIYPNPDAYDVDWDFASEEEAFRYAQRICHHFSFPAVRSDTNTVDKEAFKVLWDQNRTSDWAGRKDDVRFRIEGSSYIWEKDGVTYTAAARTGHDPSSFIELMDACGVDAAVLQTGMHFNKFAVRMAKLYPGRFLPLALLDEDDYATPKGIEKLHQAVELGAKGLYHNPYPTWDCFDNFESKKYKPFWDEVAKLGLPVWSLGSALKQHYPDILPKLLNWMNDTPEINRVLVHGFPPQLFLQDGIDGPLKIPPIVKEIFANECFYSEILPDAMEYYKHPRTDDMVKALYNEFGGTKFTWGSEFIKAASPHTKEHYSEMIGYFERVCTYMSKSDRDLILGDNLRRVFRLP